MEEIREFEETIGPFLATWKSVDVRAIVDSRRDSLLSMVACLSPNEPLVVEQTDQLHDIAFLRGSLGILELTKLLAGWQTGSVTLAGQALDVSEFKMVRFHQLDRQSDMDLARGWPEHSHYPYFAVRSTGTRNLEAIVSMQALTAGARVQGFGSFGELALQRVQFEIGSSYSLRLNIYAPVLVGLDATAATEALTIDIRYPPGLDASLLTMGYRIVDDRGNRVAGAQLTAADFESAQLAVPEPNHLRMALEIPAGSARAELRVGYLPYRNGTEPVSVAFVDVPRAEIGENPRWMVVRSLIENTRTWTTSKSWSSARDTLLQWLGHSSPRPQPADFERAVHLLVYLAGSGSWHAGEVEGSDIVLNDPVESGRTYLISCTTSADISGKIAELKVQVNRVRESAPASNVAGVLAAPLDRNDLTLGALQDAQAADMGLLLKPQLKEVYDSVMGRDWPDARSVLSRILNQRIGSGQPLWPGGPVVF